MFKKIIIVNLIFISILSSFSFSEEESIKVVMDNNYPPYAFVNSDSELVGITIDQWLLFEEKTGIKVELVGLDWAEAQARMNSGEYDVIDTIFKNSEREKIYTFTEPYDEIKTSIYFHNKISGITDLSSAQGFSIASKTGGYSVSVLLKAGIDSIPLYDSYEDIINAADSGEIVMFLMDNAPAEYFMYKLGIQDQFNHTEPIYTNLFYRAVHIDNTELVNIINNGFNLISDKEYDEINKKWYGSSIIDNNFKELITNVSIGLITSVVVLVLLSIFLKTKINNKTKELNELLENNVSLNKSLNAVINSIQDLIFVLDYNGIFLDYLGNDEDNVLHKREDIIGKSFHDLFPSNIAAGFMVSFNNYMNDKIIEPYEYDLKEIGAEGYYELRFMDINDGRVLAIVRDITEQKENQMMIYELGIKDKLTGVYNRNYFEDYISDLDEKHEEYGVIICDVDALKLVNDTLGHSVGDDYLKNITSILASYFGDEIMVARIGGDEFAVIIIEASLVELEEHKQEIKRLVNEHEYEYSFLNTYLSVGYALKNNSDESIELVVKEADSEMYREKIQHKYSKKSGNVNLLMNMLETRHFETGEHAKRLEVYGVKVAKKLGMIESFVNRVALLGEFHDIGKIGISDQILLKPGSLTRDEYEEMKKHSEIGYRIAKSLPEIEHIADIIYKHHEHFNGGGYPFGLKGEEIPLECRILSVVDAYDAMTNDRPYRSAMTSKDAIKELIDNKESQFDPNIVDLFIEILSESV